MFFAVACSGVNSFSWKEEVRLSNDEIITVQRTVKSKDFGEIGGPGGWENEGMTVEIILPIKTDNPPIWNDRFVPIIFDQDQITKEWVMVATFYSCESWVQLGKPKLPYTEYIVKNGKWIQQQKPIGNNWIGRKANMLSSIRSSGEPNHKLLTKEKIMKRITISPEFTEIVSNWEHGC